MGPASGPPSSARCQQRHRDQRGSRRCSPSRASACATNASAIVLADDVFVAARTDATTSCSSFLGSPTCRSSGCAAFWEFVDACLTPDGSVCFVDDAYRTPDEFVEGASRRRFAGACAMAARIGRSKFRARRRNSKRASCGSGQDIAVSSSAGPLFWARRSRVGQFDLPGLVRVSTTLAPGKDRDVLARPRHRGTDVPSMTSRRKRAIALSRRRSCSAARSVTATRSLQRNRPLGSCRSRVTSRAALRGMQSATISSRSRRTRC